MSTSGRERVVPVRVTLSDAPILPMDDYFRVLVPGDLPGLANRILLRFMD